MSKKLTNEEFIKVANNIHNNKYDYSLVNYINNYTKVKIICPLHGIFEQEPRSHYERGCKQCSNLKKSSFSNFISISNQIHNFKYDYSLIDYKNHRTKIKIICPIHGVFEQFAGNHIRFGHGCPKCYFDTTRHTKEIFISNSKKIHGEKFDYSLVEYKNAHTKVKIICKIHGVFNQTPTNHLKGQGCPICQESKGEIEISKILSDMNISFINQYKFISCTNKRQLPFDFYLPHLNICIEYDGEQHFREIKKYGGKKGLETRQKNDEIKTTFCKENNIKLIRIKYDENIQNKLKLFL